MSKHISHTKSFNILVWIGSTIKYARMDMKYYINMDLWWGQYDIILSGQYGFWQEICLFTDGPVTRNWPMCELWTFDI